jgi:hypothetical protein
MSDKYNIAFIKIYEYVHAKPTLVYIAVGSATNTLYNDNNTLTINPDHNQQYPVFLQDFKKCHPEIPVIIVLIDERLHTDPFIVKSRYIKDNSQENNTNIDFNDNSAPLDDGWILASEIEKMKIYENVNKNITVFAIKDNVDYKYCDYICSNNEDITDFNISIATAVSDAGGCFVFNDYSGRDFSRYVEYMNREYHHCLNRVLLGIGCSYNECMPALTEPSCLVQLASNDGTIKVFNPQRYIQDPGLYNEDLPSEFSVNIIKYQLRRHIYCKVDSVYNNLFPVYRNIILTSENDKIYNLNVQKYFNNAKKLYGDFDFTHEGVINMIKIQFTIILRYIGCESKCDDIMSLLKNKNIYDGIQRMKDAVILVIDNFIKNIWDKN